MRVGENFSEVEGLSDCLLLSFFHFALVLSMVPATISPRSRQGSYQDKDLIVSKAPRLYVVVSGSIFEGGNGIA
jgi:hypothetical protein